MSFIEPNRKEQHVIVLETTELMFKFRRVIWGLNDNHWDVDEILSLIFDAITQYGHLRPVENVVDIYYNYAMEITQELYNDALDMREATNTLGRELLVMLKRFNYNPDGVLQFIYAGLAGSDIVVEIRKPGL